MKVTEGLSQFVNFDPDILYWIEGDYQTMYMNYIRVFYMQGDPAYEEIGVYQKLQ